MDYSKQKQWYEQAYSLGDQRIPDGYGWPMEPDSIIAQLLTKIPRIGEMRGLDLGCGQGRHTFLMAENRIEAYGIDYSERAIQDARAEATKRGLNSIHFTAGDILQLPYEADFFDVIIDWSVLDHVKPEDWGKYRDEVMRVLKNGAHIILGEFSANDERVKGKAENYSDREDIYSHFFKREEIEKVFGEEFEIVESASHMLTTPPPFLVDYYLLKYKE